MTTAATTTTTTLGSDLLSVVARLNRLATSRSGLAAPYAQVRLLAQVEDLGPSRISDLARADHCSQPTMTTQVQRLESQGWVTRHPDPSDARAVLVAITAAGTSALTQARTSRSAAVDPYLQALDAHDRAVLGEAVRILERVLAAAAGPTHTH